MSYQYSIIKVNEIFLERLKSSKKTITIKNGSQSETFDLREDNGIHDESLVKFQNGRGKYLGELGCKFKMSASKESFSRVREKMIMHGTNLRKTKELQVRAKQPPLKRISKGLPARQKEKTFTLESKNSISAEDILVNIRSTRQQLEIEFQNALKKNEASKIHDLKVIEGKLVSLVHDALSKRSVIEKSL